MLTEEEKERRVSHGTIIRCLEEHGARLDALEFNGNEVRDLLATNTKISSKAATDSAQALYLSKKIYKNTSGLVTVIKAGQKAGSITIRGASVFQRVILWAGSIAAGISAIVYAAKEWMK
jgi:hypothetical protein